MRSLTHKNAHIICSGCPESRIDASRVRQFLELNGWIITKKIENADLIMYRGCGLTRVNVEASVDIIKDLQKRKKETAKLIVWGCLSKIDKESLRAVYSGITFSEDQIDVLDKVLKPEISIGEIVSNSILAPSQIEWTGIGGLFGWFEDYLSTKFSIVGNEKIFQIKVSTGCLDNCSFCGVRISRGVINSKSIPQVVTEFKNGLNKGFRYFGLLATDLGAYGQDNGQTLVDLLAALTKIKGDFKIGLRNINPVHLIALFDRLRPFLASGKIWFLSSAAESGSNRMLKLMRRRYSIQEYIKCIRKLNAEYPHIFFRTQMMVGFPTETDKDFEMTMRLTDEVRFDWVEVYTFSPAKNTDASFMSNQVPEEIKICRSRKLYRKILFQNLTRKLRQLLKIYG